MADRPLILAIETSNPSSGRGGGVALGDQGAGWVEVEALAAAKDRPSGAARAGQGGNDDDLMPAIDRLFTRRGAQPRDLGTVIVSVGPGGYTGLRVACAVGKMIAAATGAACVAAPTALVVGRRVPQVAWARGKVAVALASKGESAWVQKLEPSGPVDSMPPGRVIHAPDLGPLHEAGVRTLVADRFLPISMRQQAADLGWAVVEPTFDPAACIEAWREYALPTVDPVGLAPRYPREPDAVTLWRARGVKGPPAGPDNAAAG